MRLLVEQIQDVKYLKEGSNPSQKDYYIQGIFMQGNIKNKNQRIYPTDILKEAVDAYNKNYVDKKRAFGELCHPETPAVNLQNASHIITELNQKGSNFIGKAKILGTPQGNIIKTFIDEGCLLGVSSRALGSLQEGNDGSKIVQNDLVINAVDVVHDASAPEAFVENILESAEWVLDSSTKQWVPKYMDKVLKPSLKNMKGKTRKQVSIDLFESFMKRLSK